ncbi:signaling lymphocytic activation molecule-like [Halichoeres trimaculatus]|uniref:signaling lymphocytic activation molecule-like n=1 Tax=Halichoeres trimaculatus TaxID=147232 RepID=UPI003D9E000B
MVGDRLNSLSCIFKCIALLLLWVSFYYVEALSCQHVIHKKVGDTVELSSCLPPEGVTAATWRYGKVIIANKGRGVDEKQFKNRLFFNLTDFSLTVKDLTLQDSGDYSFSSEANKQQRGQVTVTLKIHEPITEPPVLTGNSTWDLHTNTCMVSLECSSKSTKNVSYRWTIGDQTRNGSQLQHVFRTQDGDTSFNCTIYNPVSKTSASTSLKCSKKTQELTSPDKNLLFVLILIVAGSILLIVVVITAMVCHCQRSKAANSDAVDQTIYADITEVTTEDTSSSMKPCSVYETIDDKNNRITPKAQTVYDQIQLSRVKTASVSPYQEIS